MLKIHVDEDASPVKKVSLEKLLKKPDEKLPTPKIKAEKPQTPNKKVHSNKDDYNKERDSRTIFIKNLPFDTTVDDLWHVFGKDEEMTIDCRFIMNRETGTHKVFISRDSPCLFQISNRDSHLSNTRQEKSASRCWRKNGK